MGWLFTSRFSQCAPTHHYPLSSAFLHHINSSKAYLCLCLFLQICVVIVHMGTIKHMPAKHAYTLFLLLLFINLHHSAAVVASKDKVEDAVPVPVPVPVVRSEYRMVETILEHGQRRKLAPFQVCLVCRCCVMASDPTTCSNLPCCFGIDCQLPNKPFGVCAFVPKTCNCTSCASP